MYLRRSSVPQLPSCQPVKFIKARNKPGAGGSSGGGKKKTSQKKKSSGVKKEEGEEAKVKDEEKEDELMDIGDDLSEEEKMVPLYGDWQTEDYEPPIAQNVSHSCCLSIYSVVHLSLLSQGNNSDSTQLNRARFHAIRLATSTCSSLRCFPLEPFIFLVEFPSTLLRELNSSNWKHYHSYIVPGVAKYAKKLNISHAPAHVGWDHTKGKSHPLIGRPLCRL